MRLESCCVVVEFVGSDVHERRYTPEPEPYRSLSAQRLSERPVFTACQTHAPLSPVTCSAFSALPT
jgi:hypothetical protein